MLILAREGCSARFRRAPASGSVIAESRRRIRPGGAGGYGKAAEDMIAVSGVTHAGPGERRQQFVELSRLFAGAFWKTT